MRRNMILYMDHIFLWHRTVDDHLNFLAKIFDKFRQFNLRLYPRKMSIATDSANFLGFTLRAGGYTLDKPRCKIVKDYRRPRNPRQVKTFIGISNYFRRLIKTTASGPPHCANYWPKNPLSYGPTAKSKAFAISGTPCVLSLFWDTRIAKSPFA